MDVRFFVPIPSSETQRQSVRSGEKARRKLLKQKPLGTDPHLTISKQSSECWLLIGHKKCLYYCPQSANSIAWVCPSVFVLDCYCLAIQYCTCPVRSRLCGATETFISTLLSRKGTTVDSGKRSAEPFKFARLSFFPPRPLFAYPSLSRLPHSFASSPLSESLEQAKELKVLVRSVRTRYACNFQDMYSFAIS